MLNIVLTGEQKTFLRRLGKPDALNDLEDDELLELEEFLAEEVQLRGINDAGDGENEYGKMCADILTAIAWGDK